MGHALARSREGRSALALGAALTALAAGSAAAAADPRAYVVDDLSRLRTTDVDSPLARGERNAVWAPGGAVRLSALRDEVVAVQVIVEAGDAPLGGVRVDVVPSVAGPRVRADAFVESYVEVRTRSRNAKRPAESLGWVPAARPADGAMLGWVPDALVPIDVAERRAAAWAPYPLAVPARELRAVWLDLAVARDAAAGPWRAELRVASDAGPLATIDLEIAIRDATLPYRAASFFAYYDPERSLPRVGDVAKAERSVWQLLHAHHIDAIGTIVGPDDVERLRPALDGTLFTPAHGYDGPGVGAQPEVVALGVYGQLGEPGPEALERVRGAVAALPPGLGDVFVYAVDETCDSPRGPAWRRLLAGAQMRRPVLAGHTCDRDPSRQDVDLVITPSSAFRRDDAARARSHGKRVWIYNGLMPRTGPMMLDAPAVALALDGWIAATAPVDRWFLWETTFWHDDNRGGRGPIDPFTTAESFHNGDGDASLFDGLLVYPGTQAPPFEARSLGIEGVLPSMRLKALRRGIQDAGYVALAHGAAPQRAVAVAHELLPETLDDVPADGAARWPDAADFAEARARLAELVPAGASATTAVARKRILAANGVAAQVKRRRPSIAPVVVALAVGLTSLLLLWQRAKRRRRSSRATG